MVSWALSVKPFARYLSKANFPLLEGLISDRTGWSRGVCMKIGRHCVPVIWADIKRWKSLVNHPGPERGHTAKLKLWRRMQWQWSYCYAFEQHPRTQTQLNYFKGRFHGHLGCFALLLIRIHNAMEYILRQCESLINVTWHWQISVFTFR